MEEWIEFAKGPLFALTFLIMLIGLARLVVIQIYSIVNEKGRRLKNVAWKKIIADALSWIVPVKHLIPGTKVFSIVSFLCHIGLIIVPLFLADHIIRWESFFGTNLPQIGQGLADFLTLFTIVALFILLGFRIFSARLRAMSKRMDYVLLVVILMPFTTGYLAMHPESNPFSWNFVFLVHLLSAELLFILIPFTKLAHVVLFVFDRISGVHWQLRPGAGSKIAEALYGEGARV